MLRMEMRYDSLYSGLVSINKSLGGTQSMPDSEYGAMIDLMETISNRPVGEGGDAFDAVSTVATMAENGELPIQSGGEKESIATTGIKFGFSTFTTAPDKYKYDSITDASYIFYECSNLEHIPNDFDFTCITNGEEAFYNCGSLQSIPSNICLTQATTIKAMFYEAGITSVENLSAPLAENCASVFSRCSGLTSVNGISFDKATNTSTMFSNCENLKTVQNLSLPSATNCANMFLACPSLESVASFNISSNVTNVSKMFSGCTSLKSAPSLDTSNVTNAKQMFFNCTSLQHIPSMNLSKVTTSNNIWGVFSGCTNLESIGEIDLSGLTQSPQLFDTDMVNLTDVGGFPGLSVEFAQGYGLDRCPNLSKTSIENIVNNLKDISSTGVTQTLCFTGTSATYNIIYEDVQLREAIYAKGWVIGVV